MLLKVYCSCFVGPPRWQNNETYEPDECEWEGTIKADDEEWEEGFVSTICPECGAELLQSNDHFEILSDKDKQAALDPGAPGADTHAKHSVQQQR